MNLVIDLRDFLGAFRVRLSGELLSVEFPAELGELISMLIRLVFYFKILGILLSVYLKVLDYLP